MTVRKRRLDRSGRGALPSPGRPFVARREDHRQFWVLIAAGCSSEDAAVGAGVSPAVGARWFRRAGGMPPSHLAHRPHLAPSAKPLSGRSLAFAEREEIAIWRAQRHGVRESARRPRSRASCVATLPHAAAVWRTGPQPRNGMLTDPPAVRSRPSWRSTSRCGATCRTGALVSSAPRTARRCTGPSCRGRAAGAGDGRTGAGPRPGARNRSPAACGLTSPRMRPCASATKPSTRPCTCKAAGRCAAYTACLRTGRALRVPRARSRGRGKSGIAPEILISQRPAEADDRAVPGHWEGDLSVGLGSSAIGTLVERTTRFTILLHLPRRAGHGDGPRVKNGPALAGHGAEAVRDAITRAITTLPEQLRPSLTWDQGAEMSQHARLRIDAGLQVYFCDPHSPWQRGTNENTNGLLRQYFPKGTDLSAHSAEDLAAVAIALNSRPRKTLGWRTPAEALDQFLRSSHRGRVATTT